MKRPIQPLLLLRSSLPTKLAVAAIVFVAAVAAVRILTLDRLARVDAVSAEVGNRWLDSVRILGNLSGNVARIRANEAEVLLGSDLPGTISPSQGLTKNLDQVAQEIDRYRSVPHEPDETLALNGFLKVWIEHVQHAQTIESLARSGESAEAIALFEGSGRASFERAVEELRRLIDLTEGKANTARQAAAEAINRAQSFVSDLILAVVILFAALVAYLWRSFSRPILDLARRMQRLASHDTEFLIPFESRQDEVGEMARSLVILRRNTVELLESRKRLAMQAEILEGTLEKERKLAAEQRNFITTMSHELRTPLSSIDGNAQRLIATIDRTNSAQIAERAQRIRAAVFRLTGLLASLTGAMEMTNSPLQPRARRFDLSNMLNDLANYYREIGLGDALSVQIAGLPNEITGDPDLLYYAFSNLISNAFKYSPEGGIVTLQARVKDGFVEIVVEDRGVGIPAEEIEHVRERFFRGSNVGSIPGTGLGLHVVDRIVRQHGGRLEIESEIGKGTRITVALPLDTVDVSRQEPALGDLRNGVVGFTVQKKS